MKIEEIRIPAPWGHIAVKLWGDEKNEAIIVIHGVLDNAGAFDNLIPLLPDNFYYICIDLPGHGRSSFFHLSLPLHVADYIIPIKLTVDHFKREKYIFMAHSLGGQLTMFFAQFYGDRVSKIILLDGLYVFPLITKKFFKTMEESIDRLFKTIERNKKPPLTYTYEEALQKIIKGRDHDQMTVSAAKPLLERMFERVDDNKYILTVDPRLKSRLYPSGTWEFLVELLEVKPVNCPVLALLSTQRRLTTYSELIYKHYVEKKYEVHIYDGHHDMHNTDPEFFVPFIVNFLFRNKNKL